MRRVWTMLFGAAAIAASGMAFAQSTTLQQDFERAAALDRGTDKVAALAAWTALENRQMSPRSHALVLVRKSNVLRDLGRSQEAVAAARMGLAGLPTSDPTLVEDRFSAHMTLAAVAQDVIDYATAARDYAAAEAIAPDAAGRISALLGLIQTNTFVDPKVATAAVGRLDAVMQGVKADNVVRAEVDRAKAELLLNTGDLNGSKRAGKSAVQLLGGLTGKTDLRDVAARSDVAIAALLSGDEADARQYMAYTGAGRMPNGTFDPAVQMRVPECGGDAGLKPDDVAVVQFSIGDDGRVVESRPIYAAGGGEVALTFARAALDWSWTPEQVKELKPFFRNRARVELRCTTAFERPGVINALEQDFAAWLETKGLSLPENAEGSDAALIASERAALSVAENKGGTQSLTILPALYSVLRNRVVARDEQHALAERGVAILAASNAPPTSRLLFDFAALESADGKGGRGSDFRSGLRELMNEPRYTANPDAAAALRLIASDQDDNRDRSRVMLQQTADDHRLGQSDAFRIAALIRLASLEQQGGRADAARAAYQASGLSADQCSIVDSPPKLLRAGGTFPMEAAAWGFEGWTQTEFDVAANGDVEHERVILSYPPFIFTKAGTNTIKGARFSKTYRPDGSLGCGAQTQRVRFKMPG